jgi:predicted esterase
MDEPRHCTFAARLDCHYLLSAPEAIDSRTALVVTLHGYGQTPEVMLPLTRKLVGSKHVIASLEGPNRFFLREQPEAQIGVCWNTKRHSASGIRLHHDMVQHVLSEAGREFAIPPERRILVGFSQPVAMNYRFAATCPNAVAGVLGICGGLPGDWESGTYQPVTAAILHIAGRQYHFYAASVTEQYAGRLRLRVRDVEFHLVEGGHRVPSKADVIVKGWLDRILR